jgi:hypothetical protein
MDGFLRQIAAFGDKAPLVWAVPLANIDGIEQGDYGKDNFPCDLNRAWGNPPMRHETLVFQRDMQNWAKRCRPVLGVDFHAPGAWEDAGVYAFVSDPEKFPDHQLRLKPWLEAFKQALSGGYAATSFARVANYPSRWEMPTLSKHFFQIHGMAGISLETPYALCGQILLTPKEYRDIGMRLATAVVERLEKTAE